MPLKPQLYHIAIINEIRKKNILSNEYIRKKSVFKKCIYFTRLLKYYNYIYRIFFNKYSRILKKS